MEQRSTLGIVMLMVMLGFGTTGPLAAEEPSLSYPEGATKKLGRGLANVITAPLELLREPYLLSQLEGGVAAVTVGLMRGIASAIIREAAGVFEVATFFLPIPKNFQPLVKPEYIYAHGDWVP